MKKLNPYGKKQCLNLFLLLLYALSFSMNSAAGVFEDLTLVLSSGKAHQMRIERVFQSQELTHGMMNRSSWGRISGMLFDFGKQVHRGFWMKDTLLPLDLLFVDPKGQVVFIYEGMHPESLDIVTPPVAYRAALELPQGMVKKLSITLNTMVHHPIFMS